MFNRAILVADLAAIAILLVLMNFTTPTDIGPLGVLLFFVLVYVILYGVAVVGVKVWRSALQKKGKMEKKDYLYAAVIAFAPIMILLVQSLGSLSWFTLILVGLFTFLGCFLIHKRV